MRLELCWLCLGCCDRGETRGDWILFQPKLDYMKISRQHSHISDDWQAFSCECCKWKLKFNWWSGLRTQQLTQVSPRQTWNAHKYFSWLYFCLFICFTEPAASQCMSSSWLDTFIDTYMHIKNNSSCIWLYGKHFKSPYSVLINIISTFNKCFIM